MMKKPVFQPVILIEQPYSSPDRLAIQMIDSLHADLHETMHTARNAKQTIGVSEYGTDCMRCLARKVALLQPKVQSYSWQAQVGTFIHAGLEEFFGQKYGGRVRAEPTDAAPLYHTERNLVLHDFGHFVLEGSCDMFIEGASFGLVDDWKTKTLAKLKEAAAGKVDPVYYLQMMGYAFGWELLGKLVTHVVMYSVPRDGDLDLAKPVLMRYDRQVVIDRLAKIESMIAAADVIGWEKLILAQESSGHCFDCERFDAHDRDSFISDLTGN